MSDFDLDKAIKDYPEIWEVFTKIATQGQMPIEAMKQAKQIFDNVENKAKAKAEAIAEIRELMPKKRIEDREPYGSMLEIGFNEALDKVNEILKAVGK